jgi:hypothetical protein
MHASRIFSHKLKESFKVINASNAASWRALKENGNSVWHRFKTPAGLRGSMFSSLTYTIQKPPNIKIQRTVDLMYGERKVRMPGSDLERSMDLS